MLIAIATISCAKPEPKHPEKYKQKTAQKDKQEEPTIVAPPPAYGNKVVKVEKVYD